MTRRRALDVIQSKDRRVTIAKPERERKEEFLIFRSLSIWIFDVSSFIVIHNFRNTFNESEEEEKYVG